MNWRAKLPGPHRAVTLSQSLALRRAAQTHRGIAARLAAEGVLARGGRPFAPKGVFEIPAAHAYIAGMFWRVRRLYEGVLILLKAELTEGAAFLARSLFEEGLRLQQLAAEPESRDALILGWANASLSEQVGLLETGKASGPDSDISAASAALETRRRALWEYARRHGVQRLRPFQTVRDAALL